MKNEKGEVILNFFKKIEEGLKRREKELEGVSKEELAAITMNELKKLVKREEIKKTHNFAAINTEDAFRVYFFPEATTELELIEREDKKTRIMCGKIFYTGMSVPVYADYLKTKYTKEEAEELASNIIKDNICVAIRVELDKFLKKLGDIEERSMEYFCGKAESKGETKWQQKKKL